MPNNDSGKFKIKLIVAFISALAIIIAALISQYGNSVQQVPANELSQKNSNSGNNTNEGITVIINNDPIPSIQTTPKENQAEPQKSKKTKELQKVEPAQPIVICEFDANHIPYGTGSVENGLFNIDFSKYQECINESGQCSFRYFYTLKKGKYICEFTYRCIEKQERQSYNNPLEFKIIELEGDKIKKPYLGEEHLHYKKSDYANGKFKTTRLNFTVSKSDMRMGFSLWSHNHNLIASIKSIRVLHTVNTMGL